MGYTKDYDREANNKHTLQHIPDCMCERSHSFQSVCCNLGEKERNITNTLNIAFNKLVYIVRHRSTLKNHIVALLLQLIDLKYNGFIFIIPSFSIAIL